MKPANAASASGWAVASRSFQRMIQRLRALPRAFALVLQSSGWLTFAWMALLVVGGLLPLASVYLLRDLVDALAASTNRWIVPAAVLAGLMVVGEAVKAVQRWGSRVQAEKVSDHLSDLIQRRAVSLDLVHFEDASFYDRLHRARQHALQHPVTLLERGGMLLQNSLTLLAMAAVLVPYGWWLPLVLLLGALPAVVVALSVQLREYFWRRRTTQDQRLAWYFDHLMSSRETAAEMRAYALGDYFRRRFAAIRSVLRLQSAQLGRRRAGLEVLASLLALAVAGLVMYFMVGRYLAQRASLGDLALFAQALLQSQRLMRTLLEGVSDFYSHLFDVGDLFEFLDLEPQHTSLSTPQLLPTRLESGIDLRAVTFRYRSHPKRGELEADTPEGELTDADLPQPALDGLDLHLEAGVLHGLVGRNGAGKSTVVKLLSRLYEPESGCIELDGVDLSGIDPDELRQSVAVMFQDPVRFQATALDNVLYGDVSLCGAQGEMSLERAWDAARAADAEGVIGALSEGWQTRLGVWFEGGRDLSVGQWQRLALARACIRDPLFWLLDEPTSAMDVWSEARWFERFKTMIEGRTAVLVTHRLSAVRHCDLIHVLESGRLVESGTHDQLMALGERYAETWNLQRC